MSMNNDYIRTQMLTGAIQISRVKAYKTKYLVLLLKGALKLECLGQWSIGCLQISILSGCVLEFHQLSVLCILHYQFPAGGGGGGSGEGGRGGGGGRLQGGFK